MNLYAHQQKIISEDPKKTGLWLGTGSGKTATAIMLSRGRTFVICPKTQKEDKNWERELSKIPRPLTPILDTDLETISKETFRRDWNKLEKCDTLIIDEGHTCLGATPNIRFRKKKPIPKTSQIFEAVCDYIAKHNPERIYLCTATIMRSPMTVWAAAKVLGFDWDFYKFRYAFYVRLPMPGREVWVPKTDKETKERLANAVKKLGYVGRLNDWFDVPDQMYKTINIELTAKQKERIRQMALEYPEPIVRIGKIHQIENGVLSGDEFNEAEYFDNNKIEALKDLAMEFPKMVVFAKYTNQIRQIAHKLTAEGYKTLIMTGNTENRGDIIAEANKASQCIFIVQAQISAGWELPDYPVMVFASRTYSFVDYDQALGRIQRANNIKKNLYINLVVRGGVDEAVNKCLEMKQDFNEKLYSGDLSTQLTE